jgi:hypothetical protein
VVPVSDVGGRNMAELGDKEVTVLLAHSVKYMLDAII